MATSSQSKSKEKVSTQPKNKKISSKKSPTTAESPSSRTPSKKPSPATKRQKEIERLLKERNKPAEILKNGDPRLKQVATKYPLESTTVEERLELVRLLTTTLIAQKYGGHLGIAAPQIGITFRVAIILGHAMFNPEWRPANGIAKIDITEGCYSLPEKELYLVPRDKYGWATWFNIEGKRFEQKLTGLPAIVFQHELSHLDGKCCNDLGRKV